MKIVSFSFYANLRSNIYPIVKALLCKGSCLKSLDFRLRDWYGSNLY